MSITPDPIKQLEHQLKWDPFPIREISDSCNGCGLCRSRGLNLRMCPVFHFLPEEEAAPRAKANLLRGVCEEKLELEVLTDQMAKTVADHCIHCHICRIECPAQVNIPYLAFRCKSAYTAAHGLPLGDHFFSRMDTVFRYISLFGWPLNWFLRTRAGRWLLGKTLGISEGCQIPKLAKIPYISRAAWSPRLAKPIRRSSRKIALFVDTYGNYFDTRLPENAVKVLEHNGISVHVPTRQLNSGLAAITSGYGHYAEMIARKNIAVLNDLIRQGYKIVTLEPVAAVCMKYDYPSLVNDPETRFLAENTTDLCTFLYDLHLEGKLRSDLKPVYATVGYHAPCRSIVLGSGDLTSATPGEMLLHLIPGLETRRLERGCCGLAGTIGLKRDYFPMSRQLGKGLFAALNEPDLQAGTTDCSSCRIQMEQGSKKPTVHPVKILAYAYGLSNDFGDSLDAAPETY